MVKYDKNKKLPTDDSSDDSEYVEEDNQPKRKRPRRSAAIKALSTIKKECEELNRRKEEAALDDESDDSYNSKEDDEDDNQISIEPIVIVANGTSESLQQRMIPRRYTIDEEPAEVQEFVKLITEPIKEQTIDDQIDDFKALEANKQKELITALKEKPSTESSIHIMYKILTMSVDPAHKYMLLSKYNALLNLDNSTTEYYKHRNWLDKVCSIPFGTYKNIPVSITDGSETCAKFMEQARSYLEEAVYGQQEAKLQILQFISSKIVNPSAGGISLLLVGPPGVGKTSIIKNGIARALGWPFQFISLGGDSDASAYVGHQLVYESSHCGKIVNSLIAAKSMSLVMMFDEVDKVSTTPKGEEIQNMLVHLTDPIQNMEFEDKYVGAVPIDLGKVMFVFSANDINKIDRVLLDRMTVITLNGYTVDDKIVIAEKYLLPTVLSTLNMTNDIQIPRDVLKYVIEKYSSGEKGVRELRRSLESICQKLNMLRLYNSPDLPFHINDFTLPFIVSRSHADLFLKKKKPEDDRDISLKMMYG